MTSPENVIEIPNTIKVQIGKMVFEMDKDILVSSMVQQIIHKNNSLFQSDNFLMVFDITKTEVLNFLNKLPKEEFENFDLLGDWIEKFDEFQVNKNKVFCKDLIVEFSDKTQWIIKFLDIMTLKNEIENKNNEHLDPEDEILHDDDKFLDFVSNKLSWPDVAGYAEIYKTDNGDELYEKEWNLAKKEITKWEKNLSIMDFLSSFDTMEDEDIDDDDDED